MAFTDTISISYQTSEGVVSSGSSSVNNNSRIGLDDIALHSATLEWDVAITVADISSLLIVSDKAVALKVNSTSSPAPLINLAAGVPVVWNSNFSGSNPLTTDVVKMYFVNASGSNDANIKVRILTDDTA